MRLSSRTISPQRFACRSKLITKIGPIPDLNASWSPRNVRDRCRGRWDRTCENNDLILGWVSGKYEIGPRALGNRSILAAPFHDKSRVRLNEIKQREQFRPIAPVCLEEDAARWFGCDRMSPFMLYTYRAKTDALAAVTHVNGTARIQTVSSESNLRLYELLVAFKARTGYGVLCNTSLNFNGKGFINKMADLSTYAVEHNLDGFVVEGRTYLLKSSRNYQAYTRACNFLGC
jgi:predicted NodU family carbamoyl transferase